MKNQLVKFRHGNHKGIFHYVVFEDGFVALSEKNTGKIQYIKEHGAIDLTFNIKDEDYDVLSVDIIEEKDYIKRVYDFMLEQGNTYFKDGYENLCVLRFHK